MLLLDTIDLHNSNIAVITEIDFRCLNSTVPFAAKN